MAKAKQLVVVPLAGLGNRMRVLASCVQIAKNNNWRLNIAWPINSDLGCDITDIFENIGVAYSVVPKWQHFLLTKIYRHGAIKKYLKIYKLFSNIFFDESIFDGDIINKEVEIKNNSSKVLIATCFALKNNYDLKLFNLTDYLKVRIENEYNRIGKQYIGVHIRRTDHIILMKQSPIGNYLKQMDECISACPKSKFLLATDDEQIKKYLIKKYNKSLNTVKSELGRQNKVGIHYAIIELILLSRSSQLICSKLSSFSNTAILMGEIKNVMYV